MSVKESELIDWICTHSKLDPATVPLGPGDDTAMVMCGSEKLLVTADQVLDGVHFILTEHGPEAAGRKAMSRNLSDVAAMAALPIGAVSTVAMPKGLSRQDAEALFRGMRTAADPFHCPMVGGDIGAWSGPLALSVTVFARPAGIKPVLRSGAKPGDAICVTGNFGGAWKSKRHINFLPRINEARILACRHELHSMIDVSDGLAWDMEHICKASGMGAEIIADHIPIHREAKADKAPGAALNAALNNGEDYELLFTLPASHAEELLKSQPLSVKISCIGNIVEGKGIAMVQPDGKKEELKPVGWDHQT
ncbi:MAG: thiamine-phosphate kinase [Planctomycetes bacterium]|nr:thiamine-phosphate kinase [Planctomycetota bacterium]